MLYADKDRDLALLSADIYPTPALRLSEDREVMQGEKVSLVGYPGYAPGAETFVVTATITERRPISGRSCYILSEQVVPGQSGGPILDVHGYVVGVSQRGRTTNSRGEREGMDSGIGLRELLRFVEDARAARVI